MFCYQRNFGCPTEIVTAERFWALVRAPHTSELIDGYRATGDAALKRKLPAFIFQATFEETVSKKGNKGAWRCQAGSRLNGLCVMDVDHIEEPKAIHDSWLKIHDFKALGILLIYITPSGKGLKIVFKADAEKGNLIDNQHAMAKVLGVEVDESCKDASRMSFICKESDILYLDEELFTYENPDFGKKFDAEYRQGNSQATRPTPDPSRNGGEADAEEDPSKSPHKGRLVGTEMGDSTPEAAPPSREGSGVGLYHNVPYSKIVEAWVGDKKIEPGDRHRTSLVLADHLRYITDNDPKLIEQILRETPFVKQIIEERNEDVSTTVKSAQGYEFLKGIPKRMREALASAGADSIENGKLKIENSSVTANDDVYGVLPLEAWAEELLEMAQYYPCLKELFMNVHPHKLPAVWFSSAALFGTLMTRAWYHFWYEPELVRRLNYSIFIIGDPGAGKNIMEKFYKKIADPMIQADQCLIDAVNRYKEGRTERSISTKAQKGEALKRPEVGIRVHPARTATGEFIRHMNAAIETVQGQPLNLHMFSFDAELDNVTKQNKGGDWKDREIMELKAFHNEEEGQMYANQESYTGVFNIYWNFIYTGTPYALHRKVNQRNFGTGMSTRLAVIPLPDKGTAKRHQQVDPSANETLKTWAYRLDKVEGEIPIEPLNDETYEWQTAHLEIAEFNGDKADRTLLKRIPYYGIGISLPFILMRHWEEWQEKKTLTMDERDKRLCRLAMEIQYKCQQFFFGEMAHNYFENQNKEFVQHRRTTRYDACFRKLPDEFKTQQFMECFNCSQPSASKAITRFQNEKIVEKVKYGLYRKLVNELP